VAKRFVIIPALLLFCMTACAETQCFHGDADGGELAFTGAVAGSSFTGLFGEFTVEVCMADGDLSSGQIEVVVKTASADTGHRDRDAELLGEKFFHVERYPQAIWQSESIESQGDGFRVEGRLKLRGISATQPVTLTVARSGGDLRLVGSAEILRLDYNVGTDDPDFEDAEFIRNRVDLRFDLALQR